MDAAQTEDTGRLDRLEAELDDLHDRIESCGQAMLLSRAAIGLGFATACLTLVFTTPYSTAPVILGAFTAIIGGLVWLGASKATKDELQAEQVSIEAERNRLFDQVAARNGWVGGAQTVH